MKTDRRTILKNLGIGGLALGFSPKSYARILGSNERLGVGNIGLNSRMEAHISSLRNFKDRVEIRALCDVDKRNFDKTKSKFAGFVPADVACIEDFRKLLERKDIDCITIATPDHWHAPMGILGLQAGKHVYLEKPCSHNPQESLWLETAQKKSGKVLQIGNQQRSAPTTIQLHKHIKEGAIGEVYMARTFYENWRGTIGTGKETAVPEWLNWDLFQGPAPRQAFRDNIVHYNWHWFKTYGTGEIANNGLHEMDIARMLLGVDIPVEVNSSGGRFAFQDDWEFFDTQIANFKFPNGKILTWEGRSCNGKAIHKNAGGRGIYVFGTKGSAYVDRDGFEVYDKGNKVIFNGKEGRNNEAVDRTNTVGISGLDNYHFQNFLNAITRSEALNSPITEGVKSMLLCHLGNMAQFTGKTLKIDPITGQPKDKDAMKMWRREYQKGWEVKV